MAVAADTLVYSFSPTIPAGTPVASPWTSTLAFPPLDVLGIDWQMPPGPNGHVGWQLGDSTGDIIVPTNGGYIVSSNTVDEWQLWDAIETGDWTLTGYNTGKFPHTVYLRFLCVPHITETTSDLAVITEIDLGSLEGGYVGSLASAGLSRSLRP